MHIGVQELIIILLIAAVVFGGTKISGLGKALGKSVREFKDEVPLLILFFCLSWNLLISTWIADLITVAKLILIFISKWQIIEINKLLLFLNMNIYQDNILIKKHINKYNFFL